MADFTDDDVDQESNMATVLMGKAFSADHAKATQLALAYGLQAMLKQAKDTGNAGLGIAIGILALAGKAAIQFAGSNDDVTHESLDDAHAKFRADLEVGLKTGDETTRAQALASLHLIRGLTSVALGETKKAMVDMGDWRAIMTLEFIEARAHGIREQLQAEKRAAQGGADEDEEGEEEGPRDWLAQEEEQEGPSVDEDAFDAALLDPGTDKPVVH